MGNAVFVRNWGSMLLKGLTSLAFGLLLVVWPGITLRVVIRLFGIFALLFGVVWGVVFLVNLTRDRSWGWSLALSAVGIFLGILALTRTYDTGVLIALLLAFWLVVSGAVMAAASTVYPPDFGYRWILALDGALSIIIGLLLLLFTRPTALLLALFAGVYFIAGGLMDIFLSFKVRGFFKEGADVVILD